MTASPIVQVEPSVSVWTQERVDQALNLMETGLSVLMLAAGLVIFLISLYVVRRL